LRVRLHLNRQESKKEYEKQAAHGHVIRNKIRQA
jgi:hypothetical protein